MGWFATALRQAMAERDMSVGVLARRLETSPSLVRKWRAGTAVPSVERAAEIADAVGAPYAELCLPIGLGAASDRREDPVALAEADAPPLDSLPPRTAAPARESA